MRSACFTPSKLMEMSSIMIHFIFIEYNQNLQNLSFFMLSASSNTNIT